MIRSVVVSIGVAGILLGQWSCSSDRAEVSTPDSKSRKAAPQEAQKFPFSYHIDQETCAQDEVVDIDLILHALCSPPSALIPSQEFEVPVSPLCNIKSDLTIMCDPMPEKSELLICSSSMGNIPGEEGLIRVSLTQTDQGRLPPPKHASPGSPCGSLLESLSRELRSVAKLEGRRATPLTNVQMLENKAR